MIENPGEDVLVRIIREFRGGAGGTVARYSYAVRK